MSAAMVAIVGRPNVGKSTLFNRLTGRKTAIVDDQPGITRDRLYGFVSIAKGSSLGYNLIDTGGFETGDFNFQPFDENFVWQQTQVAIEESDLVILMFDGKDGLQDHDKLIYEYLKKTKKTFLAVVNKVDGKEQSQDLLWEFLSLGLDEDPIALSASFNRGIKELRSAVQKHLESKNLLDKNPVDEDSTRVAIIGRPNVGKSSLLNRLTSSQRAIVSDVAGTTRDAIDAKVVHHGKPYVLVDTAGIRRKTKIKEALENYSVIRSINAIEKADVVLSVLDAKTGLTDQDLRLINLAVNRFKPVAIIINKWDLVPNKESLTSKQYDQNLAVQLGDLVFIPTLYISCETNQRIPKVLDLCAQLSETSRKRVDTRTVNDVLQRVVHEHTPQLIRKYNKRVKFYFATQVDVAPPTFVIKCNVSDEIQDSYKRYMQKKFAKYMEFNAIPIRMIYRGKSDE